LRWGNLAQKESEPFQPTIIQNKAKIKIEKHKNAMILFMRREAKGGGMSLGGDLSR